MAMIATAPSSTGTLPVTATAPMIEQIDPVTAKS